MYILSWSFFKSVLETTNMPNLTTRLNSAKQIVFPHLMNLWPKPFNCFEFSITLKSLSMQFEASKLCSKMCCHMMVLSFNSKLHKMFMIMMISTIVVFNLTQVLHISPTWFHDNTHISPWSNKVCGKGSIACTKILIIFAFKNLFSCLTL